jgi:hypothetical protein
MITDDTNVLPMLANVYRMLANVCPMVINVYQMVAKESSVADPQKVAKTDEKSEKWKKHELATLL